MSPAALVVAFCLVAVLVEQIGNVRNRFSDGRHPAVALSLKPRAPVPPAASTQAGGERRIVRKRLQFRRRALDHPWISSWLPNLWRECVADVNFTATSINQIFNNVYDPQGQVRFFFFGAPSGTFTVQNATCRELYIVSGCDSGICQNAPIPMVTIQGGLIGTIRIGNGLGWDRNQFQLVINGVRDVEMITLGGGWAQYVGLYSSTPSVTLRIIDVVGHATQGLSIIIGSGGSVSIDAPYVLQFLRLTNVKFIGINEVGIQCWPGYFSQCQNRGTATAATVQFIDVDYVPLLIFYDGWPRQTLVTLQNSKFGRVVRGTTFDDSRSGYARPATSYNMITAGGGPAVSIGILEFNCTSLTCLNTGYRNRGVGDLAGPIKITNQIRWGTLRQPATWPVVISVYFARWPEKIQISSAQVCTVVAGGAACPARAFFLECDGLSRNCVADARTFSESVSWSLTLSSSPASPSTSRTSSLSLPMTRSRSLLPTPTASFSTSLSQLTLTASRFTATASSSWSVTASASTSSSKGSVSVSSSRTVTPPPTLTASSSASTTGSSSATRSVSVSRVPTRSSTLVLSATRSGSVSRLATRSSTTSASLSVMPRCAPPDFVFLFEVPTARDVLKQRAGAANGDFNVTVGVAFRSTGPRHGRLHGGAVWINRTTVLSTGPGASADAKLVIVPRTGDPPVGALHVAPTSADPKDAVTLVVALTQAPGPSRMESVRVVVGNGTSSFSSAPAPTNAAMSEEGTNRSASEALSTTPAAIDAPFYFTNAATSSAEIFRLAPETARIRIAYVYSSTAEKDRSSSSSVAILNDTEAARTLGIAATENYDFVFARVTLRLMVGAQDDQTSALDDTRGGLLSSPLSIAFVPDGCTTDGMPPVSVIVAPPAAVASLSPTLVASVQVTGVVAASLGMMSPSTATQQAMIGAALSLSQCAFQHDAPLPVSLSPSGQRIGPPLVGSYYRGAIVYNAVIFLACTGVVAWAAVALSVVAKRPAAVALSAVKFPGILVVPFLLLQPGMASSASSLLVGHGARPAWDIALACVELCIVIAFFAALAVFLRRSVLANCECHEDYYADEQKELARVFNAKSWFVSRAFGFWTGRKRWGPVRAADGSAFVPMLERRP